MGRQRAGGRDIVRRMTSNATTTAPTAPTAPPIRILSVDDHPLIRAGIIAIVESEPDLEIVAEAANGEEALDQFRRVNPDIVLMDLRMPVMDGLDAAAASPRRWRCASPSTRHGWRRRHLWVVDARGGLRYSLAAMNAHADGRVAAPAPRPYGEADGLRVPRLRFSNTSATFAKDGRWWASTPGGVAVYDPRFDARDSVAPQPFVEEINVDGTMVAPTPPINIPPRPARVEIHYTAASLRAPAQVRLEYRLDGADKSWVAGAPARVATDTQLRPGRYTFLSLCSASAGCRRRVGGDRGH